MYKTSKDRRFQKNKKALQQAFIELTVEKGYSALTVSAITRRADVDRMTFYSHYDTIDDIFREFVDDMEHEISERISEEGGFNIDRFFEILNSLMYKEIEFFRHAAAASSADLRTAFKDTIGASCSILIAFFRAFTASPLVRSAFPFRSVRPLLAIFLPFTLILNL